MNSGNTFDKVLCFGNVPPTVRLKGKVYTYFHNYLLLSRPKGYPPISSLKKQLKMLMIGLLKDNSDLFIVQSTHTQTALTKRLGIPKPKCITIPFYKTRTRDSTINQSKESFLYLSDGNPHKNHINLLQSWRLLFQQGLNYELNLTVTDEYPDLLKTIEQYKRSGLNIVNHGFADPEVLLSKCGFLIYPSLSESFGLGLVEAVDSGCEVITADLPYAYSVVEPLATFDPYSPRNIADTVISIKNLKSSRKSKVRISDDIEILIELILSK